MTRGPRRQSRLVGFIGDLFFLLAWWMRRDLYLPEEESRMSRNSLSNGVFIAFLMELLSLIGRWLNPEMSEQAIATLAGEYIRSLTTGQPEATGLPGSVEEE